MNQDECLSSVQENQFQPKPKQTPQYLLNNQQIQGFQDVDKTKNKRSHNLNQKQKLKSSQTGYQLRFPELPKQEQQLERNKTRNGRRGKILIQKTKGQREQQLQLANESNIIPIKSEKNLKIYDLLDQQENEEQIAQTTNAKLFLKKQNIENTQKQGQNDYLQPLEQITSNDHNSFLEIQAKNEKFQTQEVVNKEGNIPSKETYEEALFHKVDFPNNQPSQQSNNPNEQQENVVPMKKDIVHVSKSRLLDGTKSKGSNLKQGFFYGQNNEEDSFDFVRIDSKTSLDTGPQLTSSRDQLSSRHIIDYSYQRPRRRLPALQPLSKVLNKQQQVYDLRIYQKLENSEKKPKTMQLLKNGKFGIKCDDIQDIYSFVRSPIPFNRTLESTILRNKSCSKWYLDYDLSTNDGKYLISCKKIPFNWGSTYRISLVKGQFATNSQYLIGQVRGNFVGSIFNIYVPKPDDPTNLELQATVFYQSQCNCSKNSCRQIQTFLKNRSYPIEQLEGTLHKGKNLKELYNVNENQQRKKIKKYVNKKPIWCEKRQTFVLNLRGKSRFASVKNMMLVDEQSLNEQAIIIAKKADNQFELDISYPFSPVVALGLAMTGFDFKLASQ